MLFMIKNYLKKGILGWVQNISGRRMVSFVTFCQKRGMHDYQRKL